MRNMHQEVNQYECDKCDFKGKRKQYVERHIKIVHDQIKDYECNVCPFRTYRNWKLDVHKRRKHFCSDLTELNCEECSYKTFHKENLRNHVRYMHSKESKSFKCDTCNILEEITFVTLDFQNGYFTVYPTDTANAHPTLLTHCPIFLTHIYFI